MEAIDGKSVPTRYLLELGEVEQVEVEALADSRLLLVAGQPHNEPFARRGSFVMKNEAELRQAFDDDEAGRFK